MPYRIFRDAAGEEWAAWDVLPTPSERREGERRETAGAKSGAPGERRRRDRRLRSNRREAIAKAMPGGWLCFEGQGTRRRLAPIPPDWWRCCDADLQRYRDEAVPVRSSMPISSDSASLSAQPEATD